MGGAGVELDQRQFAQVHIDGAALGFREDDNLITRFHTTQCESLCQEFDPLAFDDALKMNSSTKKQYAMKQDDEDRKQLDKKWDKLNASLKQKVPGYVEPNMPFKSNTLIRDFNELYAKIYDKEKFI